MKFEKKWHWRATFCLGCRNCNKKYDGLLLSYVTVTKVDSGSKMIPTCDASTTDETKAILMTAHMIFGPSPSVLDAPFPL
jgi:hypothetical protein